MRAVDLPNPGISSGGQHLRHVIARVIGQVTVAARRNPSGTTPAAESLFNLFTAAANAVAGLRPEAPEE